VHALLSLHVIATWVHALAVQPSVVQELLSLHDAGTVGVCTHPVAVLHVSVVQILLSSQLGAAPPTQTPPEHVSLVVQALLSLHDAVLFVKTHPVAVLQVSFVQTLLSLQVIAALTQVPHYRSQLCMHCCHW
jgi:hypothetical protein